MAGKVKILGIDNVMRNLNLEMKKIKGRSLAGLIKAVAEIHRDTEKSPPVTPADTGNLHASWFTVTARGQAISKSPSFTGSEAGERQKDHKSVTGQAKGKVMGIRDPVVVFGFSANYAGFVHESRAGKKWKRKGSGPRFLESSINNIKPRILAIIASNTKI